MTFELINLDSAFNKFQNTELNQTHYTGIQFDTTGETGTIIYTGDTADLSSTRTKRVFLGGELYDNFNYLLRSLPKETPVKVLKQILLTASNVNTYVKALKLQP